jgi:CBS domain-containing protein
MIIQRSIAEVMTTKPLYLKPNDLMTLADRLFAENNFHHLPVVDDDGVVVGIISKVECYCLQDALSILKPNRQQKVNERLLAALLVKDVMKKNPMVLHADDAIVDAALIFHENKFHALPIVDEDGKLSGIITTHDLIRYAYL